MTLSKVNEYVIVNGDTYSLSSNECEGYIEKGYVYQTSFERNRFPVFLYNVDGV